MRRLLIYGAAFVIGIALSAASHADGLPSCPCPPHARSKAKVKVVHRVRHRHIARGPVVVALPGPYDLHAVPPSPLDSAYEPAMVAYFRDPSITGYWPGSAPAYVVGDAGDYVEGIYYHRSNWPGYRAALRPPPRIDNFPFRRYEGATVWQYDGLIGEYVQLSVRDAALAMQVANAKPVLLPPPVPR
jgi:hypothetical protein